MPLQSTSALLPQTGPSPSGNDSVPPSPRLCDLPDRALQRVARHLSDASALSLGRTCRRIEHALEGRVLLPIRLAAQIPWLAVPEAFGQAVERLLRTPARHWPRLIAMLDRQSTQMPRRRGPEQDALTPLEARLSGPIRIEADVECLPIAGSRRLSSLRGNGHPETPPSLDAVLRLPLRARARVLPRWMRAMRESLPRLPLAQWLDMVRPLPVAARLGVMSTVVMHGFAGSPEEQKQAHRALLDSALADATAPDAFDWLLVLARHHWDRDRAPLAEIAARAADMPAARRLLLQSFFAIGNGDPSGHALRRWDELSAQTLSAETLSAETDELDESGRALLLQGLIWFALQMPLQDASARLGLLDDGVMRLSPPARAALLPDFVHLCETVLRGQGDAASWNPPAWMTPSEMALTIRYLARYVPPTRAVWRQMVDVVFGLPEHVRYPAVLQMGKLMLGFSYRPALRMAGLPAGVEGAPWPEAQAQPPAENGALARCREWPADIDGARIVMAEILELVPPQARSTLLGALIDNELKQHIGSNTACLTQLCLRIPATDRRLPAVVGKLIRLVEICAGPPGKRDAMLRDLIHIPLHATWTADNTAHWRYLIDAIDDRLSTHATGY